MASRNVETFRAAHQAFNNGGNIVVAEFAGQGVNDGPMGPLPATGRSMSLPFCEIMRFNNDGQIVSGAAYYDQMSIMVQLGHVQPAGAASAG